MKKIKELIERDRAMPIKQYIFKTMVHDPIDLCPVCGTSLYHDKDEYPFCPKCGQRCDRDNIAF